jgi:hypothetical protein
VETLHDYLADRHALEQHNCSFTDFPEALRVLDLLEQLPVECDWDQATAAIAAVAAIIQDGVTVEEVETYLARHRRLVDLGFHLTTAEALAVTLREASVHGNHGRPSCVVW